jgi:PAS domain-containing protein
LSAWIGGLWGGLAGTTIATLLVWYVFMPPRFSFALDSPTAALPILLFLVMGALFAFFFERLHRAQARGETRFEATFEQAAVGIALVALDGSWLRVNRKLCEIVGYDRDELLARTFQESAWRPALPP